MKKTTKYSIGIFGGTFDPPHKGHLKISMIGIKKLKLKKLYWVITNKNPFKNRTFLSLKTRILKCKKMTSKNKVIKIIYLEKKIKSPRSINILNYFKKKNNFINPYFFLGSDNLINFHKWKSWKKISKLCRLVVFSRRGYDIRANKSEIVTYLSKKNIIFVKNKKIDISSTKIRSNLRNK